MSAARLNTRPLTSALALLAEERELASAALRLAAGEYLFSPDRPARTVYLVTSGLLRLIEPAGSGTRLARTLGWAGPGELVGWSSLTGGPPDRVRARAERETRVLPLPIRWLARRMARQPRLALEIIARLARDLRAARTETGEMIRLETPQRLARALGRLAGHPALAQRDGRWTIIRLTHADLASRTGISRETVSLILSRWRRMGVVKTGRGRLALDAERLAALAGNL